MRLALVLVATVGCDGVFQLTHVGPPPPDAPPDAARPCFNPEPFGATCRTIMVPLIADTALSSAMPDTAYGTKDAVKVTASDPGLFKFDLAGIESTERIAGARLAVPVVTPTGTAIACGTNGCNLACGPSSVESSRLYWLTPDWSQQYATFNAADQNLPWNVPGAAGTERSELVATGLPPTNNALQIDVAPEDIMRIKPECFATTQLGMLVLVQGTAWFRQLGNQPCTIERSATLELTLCK